jgi:death-on-curing protein
VNSEPKWISTSAVLAIHERLLAEHGGPSGVDEGRLEAALSSPRNHFAYGERNVFRLATAYAFAITRDHPFRDGNKRVALTLAGLFLELNGFRLEAPESSAAEALIALSAREIDEAGFVRWLEDYSSHLKPTTHRRKPTSRKR